LFFNELYSIKHKVIEKFGKENFFPIKIDKLDALLDEMDKKMRKQEN
jgi:hypothetical protein